MLPAENDQHRLIGAILGALVFALGALALAGRHLDLPILFQFRPNWLPTQYNPALCLVALGLALVALAARRTGAAVVLAAVPVVVGTVTLLTWLFDLRPGIDQVFFHHDAPVVAPAPGRMSPVTALAFGLSGLAVGLTAGAQQVPAKAVIAWAIAIVTGIGASLATVLVLVQGASPAIESIRFTYVSPQIGLGIALAGGAILLLTTVHKRSASPEDRGWRLPVASGVTTAMIALVLWQGFAVAGTEWVLQDTRIHGRQIVERLESESRYRSDFFARMARQAGKQTGLAGEASWASYVSDLVNETPWLLQINWLNLDGTVRYQAGHDRTADLVAEEIIPIPGRDAYPVGKLVVKTDLKLLLPQLIDKPDHGFNVGFGLDSTPAFTLPASAVPRDNRDRNVFEADVTIAGSTMRLVVWPGPSVHSPQQTWLPRVTLLFGIALSLLLSLALRSEAVSRRRATSIARARELIEHEVEERRRAEEVARNSEARTKQALSELRQILDQSQDLICTVNRDGQFLVVSESSTRVLGYRPEEMIGRYWSDFVHPDDLQRTRDEVAAIGRGEVARLFINRAIHRSGRTVHLSWSSTWLAETGTSYSIGRDVTVRDRQDAHREGQRQVLQLIAGGSPLRVVLEAICRYVEMIHPESLCSLLVVDADGVRLRSAAAPSMPAHFLSEVDGIGIGPEAGSCGTAVWRKQLVVVEDIETDPLWDCCRSVAHRYGLKSCWSMPVMGEEGAVLGTFAVYNGQPAAPDSHEIEMIEAAAGLAAVAIERAEAHRNLLEGREKLEFARRVAQLGYWESMVDSERVVISTDMLQKLALPSGQEYEFQDLLQFVVEPDRAILSATREAALLHDVPVDTEIRLRLPGGGLRYVHFRGKTIRREDGNVLKLAGTVQDITSRKLIELENARLYAELEDRVRSRTRELEESNRELEAFSYSVSHDLRAPLRAISGFSALLQQEHGASMGQQGQHYLERIISGTVRMSTLIDDLLELGRVSRIELTRQPLDLSALASAVSGRLHERWPERIVDVEVQPDLVAWADLRLTEVVLENLLENAWKFTGGRPVGRIRVGSLQNSGDQTVFMVQDNGVGFDPQYAANLFGVFQRLHAASAYPGTGVGLATVQRILQRHGGRIWADARADEGATFFFTLS